MSVKRINTPDGPKLKDTKTGKLAGSAPKKPRVPKAGTTTKAGKSTSKAKATPEEIFETFRKAKREVLEKDLAEKAEKARIKAEKDQIQDKIQEKMEVDREIIFDFLSRALEEGSVSTYTARPNQVKTDTNSIIEPVAYLENDNDDDRDALYFEGHDPLISAEDNSVVGFVRGDDQIRIVGHPTRANGAQEVYETWMLPQRRGQGLELKAINRAISKKFDAKNFLESKDIKSAIFNVIVWDGNKAMALDLIKDGWTPVMPGKADLLQQVNQQFHTFSKDFAPAKTRK